MKIQLIVDVKEVLVEVDFFMWLIMYDWTNENYLFQNKTIWELTKF